MDISSHNDKIEDRYLLILREAKINYNFTIFTLNYIQIGLYYIFLNKHDLIHTNEIFNYFTE